MRIALAQIDSYLGDFEGNRAKILDASLRARTEGADLVVFPEAALFGYHPVDLLERPSTVKNQELALKKLHRELPKGLAVVLGAIVRNPSGKGKGFWNAAVFLERGQKMRVFPKTLLPTYDVFDESRHIEPGDLRNNIVRFQGQRILITICEDIWGWPRKDNPFFSTYGCNPLTDIAKSRVDLVLNLSASPFTHTKLTNRRHVVKKTARYFETPMVYVNMVGGQDELIFDGGSFAVDEAGRIKAHAARFREDLVFFDLDKKRGDIREFAEEAPEVTRQALVMGLRDFIRKTGFKRAHLGLSGGMDSALVVALAVEALGAENVSAFYLPGPFSADLSGELARDLAKNLNISLREISIVAAYEDAVESLDRTFGAAEFGLMQENLQARLRGIMLMAFSNRERSLLLGTSNKSEIAVGYSTLYGDMIGALQPIGDLLKTEVYAMAEHINKGEEIIPRRIITRPPSAELRENQTDQDSLPPYPDLDAAIRRLILGFNAPETDIERRVLDLMFKSEFKRWQSPPILKVSDHAFGRGRRFPVAFKPPEV